MTFLNNKHDCQPAFSGFFYYNIIFSIAVFFKHLLSGLWSYFSPHCGSQRYCNSCGFRPFLFIDPYSLLSNNSIAVKSFRHKSSVSYINQSKFKDTLGNHQITGFSLSIGIHVGLIMMTTVTILLCRKRLWLTLYSFTLKRSSSLKILHLDEEHEMQVYSTCHPSISYSQIDDDLGHI